MPHLIRDSCWRPLRRRGGAPARSSGMIARPSEVHRNVSHKRRKIGRFDGGEDVGPHVRGTEHHSQLRRQNIKPNIQAYVFLFNFSCFPCRRKGVRHVRLRNTRPMNLGRNSEAEVVLGIAAAATPFCAIHDRYQRCCMATFGEAEHTHK